MLTDRHPRHQLQFKPVRAVPDTSRTGMSTLPGHPIPSLIPHVREPAGVMVKDAITQRNTEHLPALVKANNYSFFSSENGQYDLRRLYEEWRVGLSNYNKVPRLCRLDHHLNANARLPALPEQSLQIGQNKRRLSQNSASSPPTFRTRLNYQNGQTNIPQPEHGVEKTERNYKSVLLKISSDVGRFECLAKIGQGSYGNVFKCRDRKTGRIVAIKKFIETEDNPGIRKIAFREIRILKQLRHPNIVALLEVFRRKQKLHLVFEHCQRTLLEEIQYSKHGIPESDTQKIIVQVLQAIRAVHNKNIIHRDIKPENILLTSNKTVKLCDFGFARPMNGAHCENEQFTDYVATRWYRAPELLMDASTYGPGIDIWATGCVFYECVSREPLLPGASDIDQLFLIKKMFGDISMRRTSSRSFPETDNPQRMKTTQIPHYKLAFLTRQGHEMLQLMMNMDATERPTADELLQRPYFSHCSGAEPSSLNTVRPKPITAHFVQKTTGHPLQVTGTHIHVPIMPVHLKEPLTDSVPHLSSSPEGSMQPAVLSSDSETALESLEESSHLPIVPTTTMRRRGSKIPEVPVQPKSLLTSRATHKFKQPSSLRRSVSKPHFLPNIVNPNVDFVS